MKHLICTITLAAIGFQFAHSIAIAQPASDKETAQIREQLAKLEVRVAKLRKSQEDRRWVADVAIYAKAAEWAVRHGEFYKPRGKPDAQSRYPKYALDALATGMKRADQLQSGQKPWALQTGTTIRGYVSRVDQSVQPYALTLPKGINPRSGQRWPLHVKLHGRGGTRNEIRFIHDHDNKPLPKEQDWVQLDVFGRTDNAYRWSGETDVFEAIADLRRTVRIDTKRITLWGFSMGGAGAWHLGLHHPTKWSSVGPGAGFVDFYQYQKQSEKRPPWQHATLRVYDSIDYALNAFNVPICTYGGELDSQLVASTRMTEAAKKLNVDIKLLIGPGMGHKFHPESFKEFMAFHKAKSKRGRPSFPGRNEIRFVTHSLKYNQCEWLTIEEVIEMYKPAIVEGKVDRNGTLQLKTRNVSILQIARDIAQSVEIDGAILPLQDAADGLLPGVYYEHNGKKWFDMGYDESRDVARNPDGRKRHNLQGPIDDAFMESFICVRGTGKPWSQEQHDWAHWTLDRFAGEFDKWLRGKIRIVDDRHLTDKEMTESNIILFGDPGSNSVLARMLKDLPIKWSRDAIQVNDKKYDPKTHGLSLIYPNPITPAAYQGPRRYVVINSGHTMHEKDFKASNSWLFPRLGDIAIQKFTKNPKTGYDEEIEWAGLFNSAWRLPSDRVDSAGTFEESRLRSLVLKKQGD